VRYFSQRKWLPVVDRIGFGARAGDGTVHNFRGMKKLFIRILSRFIPEMPILLYLYRHQLRDENSYLNLTGWTRSITEGKPCKSDGSALPWMNYPMIALLKERLKSQLRLFEYGSGYSTLFFSDLVGEVVSVEYDPGWHNEISKRLPKNATLMLVTYDVDGNYCRAIHQVDGLFDVVVVDGRDRTNCIRQALSKLNSQRDYYQVGLEHAMDQGFKRLDIEGLKPTDNGVDRATILYRSRNCFNL
jgi:hypothetical protein